MINNLMIKILVFLIFATTSTLSFSYVPYVPIIVSNGRSECDQGKEAYIPLKIIDVLRKKSSVNQSVKKIMSCYIRFHADFEKKIAERKIIIKPHKKKTSLYEKIYERKTTEAEKLTEQKLASSIDLINIFKNQYPDLVESDYQQFYKNKNFIKKANDLSLKSCNEMEKNITEKFKGNVIKVVLRRADYDEEIESIVKKHNVFFKA